MCNIVASHTSTCSACFSNSPFDAINTKTIPGKFDGKIEVENRYLFTNLNQCSFHWKLVTFTKPDDAQTAKVISRGTAKPQLWIYAWHQCYRNPILAAEVMGLQSQKNKQLN